jgi:hypothetical protein
MTALLAWLKSKNWSTHAIGISLASIATVIVSDQQAQQFLINLFNTHPAIATQIIALAGIIAAYKRSSSKAGTVAQANTIMASPNPPTASQVQAATPVAEKGQ